MDPDTQARVQHIDGLMVQLRTQIAQKQVELVALEAGWKALDAERSALTGPTTYQTFEERRAALGVHGAVQGE